MKPSPSLASALAVFAASLLPADAMAQAYQCRAPAVRSVPQVSPDGPRRIMPVTGYTMALSWSPEFCKPRQDSRAHKVQCSGDNGRFGLVVHGLWPEGPRGSWPQWCPVRETLSPAELRRNLCMMPSARLVARQWVKHGSCMTARPDIYFKVTRILWDSYRIPDYDRISREKDLTAGRIRAGFAEANGGWEPEHIGVKLNARGWLQEIRLCYNARFRPTRCDAKRFGARDGQSARIWRGL